MSASNARRHPRRGMSPKLIALALATSAFAAIVACGGGDGTCLRASDCDDGYACIQGTCRTGDRLGSENGSTSDASATDAKAATAAGDATTTKTSDASSDARDATTSDSSSDAAASDQ